MTRSPEYEQLLKIGSFKADADAMQAILADMLPAAKQVITTGREG